MLAIQGLPGGGGEQAPPVHARGSEGVCPSPARLAGGGGGRGSSARGLPGRAVGASLACFAGEALPRPRRVVSLPVCGRTAPGSAPPLPLSAHPRGRPPGCWPDCLFALSVHAHHSHGPIAALPPSPSSPIPPSPAYRPALSPPPRRCVSLRWRCPRRGRRGEPWVLAGQAGAACVRVAPVVVVAAATLAVTAAVAVTAHVRGRGAPPARALP